MELGHQEATAKHTTYEYLMSDRRGKTFRVNKLTWCPQTGRAAATSNRLSYAVAVRRDGCG